AVAHQRRAMVSSGIVPGIPQCGIAIGVVDDVRERFPYLVAGVRRAEIALDDVVRDQAKSLGAPEPFLAGPEGVKCFASDLRQLLWQAPDRAGYGAALATDDRGAGRSRVLGDVDEQDVQAALARDGARIIVLRGE